MTDRVTVYANAIPLETDILRAGLYGMIGDGKLAEAMLGSGTVVSGFTLTPSAPASLALILGPGQVYQQENVEATAWSSLAVDSHPLVKQGVLFDPATLTFTPPTTVGYAQSFLVEVQYADADTQPIVYPYFNATNPDVQFNGPGNSGTAQSSARKGAVAYQIKAGIAATAGTQAIPTPDAGWAGLFVVTLAQGATSITAGNIATYAFAPFIPATLPQVPSAVQAGQWTYGEDVGTADAYVVTLTPNTGTLIRGQRIFVRFANTNTTTIPVININGTGNKTIILRDGGAVAAGDIPVGWREVFYDGTAIRLAGASKSEISNASASVPTGALIHAGSDTSATPGTITAAVTPSVSSYARGYVYVIQTSNAAISGGTVANISSLDNRPVTRADATPIQAGDYGAGQAIILVDDGTRLQLAGVTTANFVSSNIAIFTSNASWTPPAGVTKIKRIRAWGGGGGGGGSTGSAGAGSGGGGGGYAEMPSYPVSPATPLTVTVGAAGQGGNGANGTPGGTSAIAIQGQNAFIAATGGGGGSYGNNAPQQSSYGNGGTGAGTGLNAAGGIGSLALGFGGGIIGSGIGGAGAFGGGSPTPNVATGSTPGNFPGGAANGGCGGYAGATGGAGLVVFEY